MTNPRYEGIPGEGPRHHRSVVEPVSGIRRVSLALASDGGLGALMARCADQGALDRVQWNDTEPGLRTGVLPPGVDEPRLLTDLVESVRGALAGLVSRAPVLLALHEGLARLDDGQFRGPALATVRELSRARLPEPFAVVVSQRVFEDLAALDVQPFPVARFRPFTVGGVAAQAAGWPL